MVPDELTAAARDMASGLDDALTFRRVVETGAAEMAARASLSRQQRENLAECLAAMADAGSFGYRQADTRPHLALADPAGSPLLPPTAGPAPAPVGRPPHAPPRRGRNPEPADVPQPAIP